MHWTGVVASNAFLWQLTACVRMFLCDVYVSMRMCMECITKCWMLSSKERSGINRHTHTFGECFREEEDRQGSWGERLIATRENLVISVAYNTEDKSLLVVVLCVCVVLWCI